jgi:hypothetical protein
MTRDCESATGRRSGIHALHGRRAVQLSSPVADDFTQNAAAIFINPVRFNVTGIIQFYYRKSPYLKPRAPLRDWFIGGGEE